MSKRVDICDLCEKRTPTYHFRYKAFKWVFGYEFAYKKRFDICDDCWETLAKQVRKASKHGQ